MTFIFAMIGGGCIMAATAMMYRRFDLEALLTAFLFILGIVLFAVAVAEPPQ